MMDRTLPLQRTSSADLRTPPQACLSHGVRALARIMVMRRRSMMLSTMMVMMKRRMPMKYQSSLW